MCMSRTRKYTILSSLICKKDGNFIFFCKPILVFFWGGGGENSWGIYLLSITWTRTSVVIMRCWRGCAMFDASVNFKYHHCLLHFTVVTCQCQTSRFFPLRLQMHCYPLWLLQQQLHHYPHKWSLPVSPPNVVFGTNVARLSPYLHHFYSLFQFQFCLPLLAQFCCLWKQVTILAALNVPQASLNIWITSKIFVFAL